MQATHEPSPVLVLGGHRLRLRTWAGQAPSPCSTCAAAADLLPLESRSSCAAPRAGALGTWGRPSRAALSRRGLPPAAEVPLQEALPTTLSQAPVRGAGRGAPAAPRLHGPGPGPLSAPPGGASTQPSLPAPALGAQTIAASGRRLHKQKRVLPEGQRPALRHRPPRRSPRPGPSSFQPV